MSLGTLTPAFGRDYQTKNDALIDFYKGYDFVFNNAASPYDGKYCNYLDFDIGSELVFRYNGLIDLFVHKVTPRPVGTLVFSDPNRNFTRARSVVEAFEQGSTFINTETGKAVNKNAFSKSDILFLQYLSKGKKRYVFYTVK